MEAAINFTQLESGTLSIGMDNLKLDKIAKAINTMITR